MAGEISDILSSNQMPHAVVDIDALGASWPPRGAFNQVVVMKNLTSVWQNFYEAGAERLVVSGVVETRGDVESYERAVPGAKITVCRLIASQSTREAKVRAREQGSSLEWHLNWTSELETILRKVVLEDFLIDSVSTAL